MSNSNCDSVGHYFLEQTFWFKKPVTFLVKRGKLHLCGHAQTHEQWHFLWQSPLCQSAPWSQECHPHPCISPQRVDFISPPGGSWTGRDGTSWTPSAWSAASAHFSIDPAPPAKGDHFFKCTDITYRSITLWSYYNQSQIEGSLV